MRMDQSFTTSPLTRWRVAGLLIISACLQSGCGQSSPAVEPQSSAVETTPPVVLVSNTSFKPVAPDEPPTWPHWRGINNDAISTEIISDTALDGMPTILWRHNIGIGYSAISVDQEHLYAMGHPEGTGDETMWCFEPATGEVIWSKSYPCQLLDHLHKGGPGASPTIDGEFVYFNSREGEIRKVNGKTGEEVWKFDIRTELEIPLPEWGFTCSPIVRGNEILVEAGSVIGIDRETGKLLWKTRARMPGYGTPELFEQDGHSYAAALNNEGVSIIDLDRKEEVSFYLWESPYDTNSSTPLYRDGQIFVSTGYNVGSVLLDFDGTNLKPVWQNKEMRNHMNSCVEHNGWLYGFDGNSHHRRSVTMKSINWNTGEVGWTVRDLGCGSLMATQNHIIALSDSGELILAKLLPNEYQELGRLRVLDEQCWTMPILCDGRIYCRGAEGSLACVDVRPQSGSN